MPIPDAFPTNGTLPNSQEIAEAVQRLLRSGNWAKYAGEETERLTQQIAARWRRDHVRLCPSGTAALELALRAARIGTGDEVLLCAYDFPGNLRTVEQVGARPALVDCQADGWAIDPDRLIAAARPETRAAIVSHLYGSVARLDRLRDWAERRNVLLIEDACQAPGGRMQGKPLGSWADAGILSFGGSKPLTAGCGGALLTDDPRLAQRATSIAERPSNVFPLSQIQAALLIPQLERLDELAQQRRTAARRLVDAVEERQRIAGPPDSTWSSATTEASDAEADYYKVAWIAPTHEARDLAIAKGQAAGLPVGAGYRSAGRMSRRRCRLDQPVPHADARGTRTFVLDHRCLYREEHAVDQLAEQLAKCFE